MKQAQMEIEKKLIDFVAQTLSRTLVLAVEMKPKDELALKFYGTPDKLFMIGDCNVAGDVQRAMRSAFATASIL